VAGRNKRIRLRYLRDMELALLRTAAEWREQEDRFYSSQRWRQDGVAGVEQDIVDMTSQSLLELLSPLFVRLPHPALPRCRIHERPDNWARVFPHKFTGHVAWRGNCFPFGVSSESVLTRRRWIVREIARDAGSVLAKMPCRHVGEKRRVPRNEPEFPRFAVGATELTPIAIAVEFYVRCEDCGEEVPRA
jgi:hypothetical protein